MQSITSMVATGTSDCDDEGFITRKGKGNFILFYFCYNHWENMSGKCVCVCVY